MESRRQLGLLLDDEMVASLFVGDGPHEFHLQVLFAAVFKGKYRFRASAGQSLAL